VTTPIPNGKAYAVEEAVAEDLLPYKLYKQQLYFNKIMKQLLHLVLVLHRCQS